MLTDMKNKYNDISWFWCPFFIYPGKQHSEMAKQCSNRFFLCFSVSDKYYPFQLPQWGELIQKPDDIFLHSRPKLSLSRQYNPLMSPHKLDGLIVYTNSTKLFYQKRGTISWNKSWIQIIDEVLSYLESVRGCTLSFISNYVHLSHLRKCYQLMI